VGTKIVFETHSITEDNELGHATGWLRDGCPSEVELARELGVRRRHDGLSAVFTSDLQRAVETTAVGFNGSGWPVLADWRLRGCYFDSLNGARRAAVTMIVGGGWTFSIPRARAGGRRSHGSPGSGRPPVPLGRAAGVDDRT
jgi:broad specificity phosphatase PhoE